MADKTERPAGWIGRQLLDAKGRDIGIITGLAFPRARFGTKWLTVQTPAGAKTVVPVAPIKSSGGHLVLPYPGTYVAQGPILPESGGLSRAEERRLCLHYGFDSELPGSQCRAGCGLCRASRAAPKKRETSAP